MKKKLLYLNFEKRQFFVRNAYISVEEMPIQLEFIENGWIPTFEINGWDNFKGYNGFKRTDSITVLKEIS